MYKIETSWKPGDASTEENGKWKPSTMIKIVAILCMALFFFPLCTVSCSAYGETYTDSLSGLDCAVGTELFDGDAPIEAHPLCFALFLLPALLLAAAFIRNRNRSLAVVALSVCQVIALLVFRGTIIDYVKAEASGMLETKFTFWYILDILGAIAAAVLGALPWLQTTPNRNPITRMCPHCGSPIDHDALFCNHCGQNTRVPPKPVAPMGSAPSAMLSCVNCGRLVERGARFCPGCGKNPSVADRPVSRPYGAPPAPYGKSTGLHAPTDLD